MRMTIMALVITGTMITGGLIMDKVNDLATKVNDHQQTITETISNDPVKIEEDDPRWDCNTMGNKICGSGS